jgi:hypothetical protein
MAPPDIAALELKAGQEIKIWVRFRQKPLVCRYVIHTENTVFYRCEEIIKGIAIREIATIEPFKN